MSFSEDFVTIEDVMDFNPVVLNTINESSEVLHSEERSVALNQLDDVVSLKSRAAQPVPVELEDEITEGPIEIVEVTPPIPPTEAPPEESIFRPRVSLSERLANSETAASGRKERRDKMIAEAEAAREIEEAKSGNPEDLGPEPTPNKSPPKIERERPEPVIIGGLDQLDSPSEESNSNPFAKVRVERPREHALKKKTPAGHHQYNPVGPRSPSAIRRPSVDAAASGSDHSLPLGSGIRRPHVSVGTVLSTVVFDADSPPTESDIIVAPTPGQRSDSPDLEPSMVLNSSRRSADSRDTEVSVLAAELAARTALLQSESYLAGSSGRSVLGDSSKPTGPCNVLLVAMDSASAQSQLLPAFSIANAALNPNMCIALADWPEWPSRLRTSTPGVLSGALDQAFHCGGEGRLTFIVLIGSGSNTPALVSLLDQIQTKIHDKGDDPDAVTIIVDATTNVLTGTSLREKFEVTNSCLTVGPRRDNARDYDAKTVVVGIRAGSEIPANSINAKLNLTTKASVHPVLIGLAEVLTKSQDWAPIWTLTDAIADAIHRVIGSSVAKQYGLEGSVSSNKPIHGASAICHRPFAPPGGSPSASSPLGAYLEHFSVQKLCKRTAALSVELSDSIPASLTPLSVQMIINDSSAICKGYFAPLERKWSVEGAHTVSLLSGALMAAVRVNLIVGSAYTKRQILCSGSALVKLHDATSSENLLIPLLRESNGNYTSSGSDWFAFVKVAIKILEALGLLPMVGQYAIHDILHSGKP